MDEGTKSCPVCGETFRAVAFQQRGTPAAISFCDTSPLKQTLERLVDFDRINSGAVRMSVGAVNVRSGNNGARRKSSSRPLKKSGPQANCLLQVFKEGRTWRRGGMGDAWLA